MTATVDATGGAGGGATAGAGGTTLDPSQSTLSPNFATFVNNMLAKGERAANQTYAPFTGQRYAFSTIDPATGKYVGGYSPLEQTAFTGFKNLGAYSPTTFGNQFTAPTAYTAGTFSTGLGALGSVADYMSPYASAVTDIEAREARRQADISRQAEQARLAGAGAYGGSRQAIMEAERQRNLGTQIGDITSKGLQSAYDRALQQRLAEAKLGLEAQGMGEQSKQFGAQQGMTAAQSAAQYGLAGLQETEKAKQFGAEYGLKSLQEQLAAGAKQREIAQQPLEFGYQQFQESMKYPYQQATYMQSLLGGLPLEAAKFQPEQSALTQGIMGLLGALNLLKTD